jgi:hypothetical protein
MKKHKVKDKFLAIIEKTPVIQHACEQCEISRNSYYEWMKKDPEFAQLVSDRMGIGIDLVNDVAESNVLTGIKKGDPGMTKYWLSARHKAYRRPFSLSTVRHEDPEIEKARIEEKKKKARAMLDRWTKKKK